MKVVITCLILLSALPSLAKSCLDNKLALDVQKATLFNESFKQSEKLMTTSKDGQHYSLLKLDSVYDVKTQNLNLFINFDIGSDLVALPYNLMAYEILLNGEVIHKEDFTNQCQSMSPYTFMPGDYVEIIKIKNIKPDNHSKKLQIKIWGQ
ncbi:MAG: hypothetical protein MK008_09545 [Bdellovibrionales bacterium]|nr:hypothetical protein [Bdellovibrionales bacterium]